jgi:hypothetical protein
VQAGSAALRIIRYIALHYAFDNLKTRISAPHQMKLNSSLVHGKTPKMSRLNPRPLSNSIHG